MFTRLASWPLQSIIRLQCPLFVCQCVFVVMPSPAFLGGCPSHQIFLQGWAYNDIDDDDDDNDNGNDNDNDTLTTMTKTTTKITRKTITKTTMKRTIKKKLNTGISLKDKPQIYFRDQV